MNPDRKKAIELDNNESLETFQTNNNEAEGDGEKAKKKHKADHYGSIKALRKKPDVDAQVIVKSATGKPIRMLIPITENQADELISSRNHESL